MTKRKLDIIPLGEWALFDERPLKVIAGPCGAETCEQVLRTASSLSQIHPRLIELIYGYSLIDSGPIDGEVVNGWFPWALKGTLSEFGYYSDAKNTNNFFNTLHYEIENALDAGILEREDGRIIALDSTSILSNKINVLVVEDELLD